MSDLIKIAVDAMGGDGSPKKIIDGIIFNHKKNKNNFFKKWLQRIQILELLYTNTYSLKFVSFVRIQLDTKDTIS